MDKNCIHWKENLIFCWLLWSLIVLKKTNFFQTLQDIANAWKGLEFAEKGFEEWLLSELQR